jgi:CheY-like chemotaxis protein
MPSLQHQQNSEREHASKSDRPAAPPKTSARKDGESNPPLNQETGDVIFVVDDDPDFRALLADILSDAGFSPILFNRAEGLLASLEWTIPAAIITDLVMPDLSGSQLVAVLGRSERWGRIPVVVMTGNNDTSLPLRFLVPIIYKPDISGLVSAIRGVLGARAVGAPMLPLPCSPAESARAAFVPVIVPAKNYPPANATLRIDVRLGPK